MLAERAEINANTLGKYLAGEKQSMDFDTADRLLCAIGRVDLWRGPLCEFYYAVDLNWRKCECPGCETMFKPVHAATGVTGQKYCSTQCSNTAKRIRNVGDTKQRRKNWRGTKTHCRNGHPRTPENTKTRPNGKTECRECARESARAGYAARQAGKRAS